MLRCQPWPKPETAQEKSLAARVERLTIMANNPEADGALIFHPSLRQSSTLLVFESTQKGQKWKKGLRWHLEIEPGTSDFLHRRQHTYQLRQSLILFLYLQQLFNATKTGICSTCVRFVQPLSCFTCFSHLHLYFSTSQTSIYGQLVNKDTFYGPLSVLINGIWL